MWQNVMQLLWIMFFQNDIFEEYLMTWEYIQDGFCGNSQWKLYIPHYFISKKHICFEKTTIHENMNGGFPWMVELQVIFFFLLLFFAYVFFLLFRYISNEFVLVLQPGIKFLSIFLLSYN